MNMSNILAKWKYWLLCVAFVLTLFKGCVPDRWLLPVLRWVGEAHEGVHTAKNILDGKPQRQSKKRWAEAKLGTYQGEVKTVHDGDTVHILDVNGHMHKVRLANIDAPELNQAYGEASRNALAKRIEYQHVEIKVVAIDQYKREVGQIRLNHADINLWMVMQGYAWHYNTIAKKQQNKFDFNLYQQSQLQAQQNRLGLWHNARAVAPWQFRQQKKTVN